MDSIDISLGQGEILQDTLVLNNLPEEILEVIRIGDPSRFLDTIAFASLYPRLTLRFFTRFENIFTDTCARWIALAGAGKQCAEIFEAFAQIVSFMPHLSVYLERFLHLISSHNHKQIPDPILRWLLGGGQDCIPGSSDIQLQRLLLAAFRFISFDKRIFASVISASRMQELLRHPSYPVRYLAIRIICRLLSASDMKLEEMMGKYTGNIENTMGYFDEQSVDYGFLSLYEEKRAKYVEQIRETMHQHSSRHQNLQPLPVGALSPLVSSFGGILLPRPNGEPTRQTTLVPTHITSRNKTEFARALLSPSPILVHGLAGSGKTSLVYDFARELGKDSTMVTLHLNEQTDAKILIGTYSTGSSPDSFTWRPGVLTTAVREGRWVFIEDLDRAPNEVISVILPLIERRELYIPSRGEIVRAMQGFRLIASIRTSSNIDGQENPPAMHMLGARLWKRVSVKIPGPDELFEIINGSNPILHKFLPEIRSVFDRLHALSQELPFSFRDRSSLGQLVSLRELLKWCRRLESVLVAAGSKTGNEPITESTKDEMFMEAIDCFAGNLPLGNTRKAIIFAIAEEMHIPSQRAQHYFEAYAPRYDESDSHIQIGRAKLSKRLVPFRVTKPLRRSQLFANTNHARRLLEQVGIALRMAEPILLVGETGIGKTTIVQQLADLLGYRLTAVNLSQQSEAGDLLGGFKPVSVRSFAIPLKEEFDELFVATGISTNRNQKYLEQLEKYIARGQWSKASKLWHEGPRMFERILSDFSELDVIRPRDSDNQPTKRRKTESRLQALQKLKHRWEKFSQNLDQFDMQLSGGSKNFAFTFVESNIVKAARNGEWVLLDEINLASPDTLESIAGLLHTGIGNPPSILLAESGKLERVIAHREFRIFGAMNPATDVGRRDLPPGLRSRFTEIYVESPDRDFNDLLSVIKTYLKGSTSNYERTAHDIAQLYINTKRLADEKRLVDSASNVPHFSLRTLTRVLSYVAEITPSYGLHRALYEGYAMGFLTLLNKESERVLMPLINHYILNSQGNAQSLLAQTPKHPEDGRGYIRFVNKKRDRQYWMLQGTEIPQEQPLYIITPFVERNMLNLVRATSTRRFPILVQGPTSSGKTSMIEYLAKFSGNKFVRINNHEHTDLQEYLGSYISGPDGQLQFQEGLLVKALREGHWIVLDELNLAPTDVLEALNRLLDDNRELLIPETQEIVRPHDNFMLFATQNPPGIYGGRKILSRAFRNRFLELHFDDIPDDELEYILEKRSQKVAPSDCKRIVTVYKELARRRQSTRLFEQKDSFATLRDLFRWASRDAENREQLAAHGYMLLAERVRKAEERVAVKEIIERVMKVKLDPNALYSAATSPEISLYESSLNSHGIVWTYSMRRLYILVANALHNNEPVLLVGETGCGKTTVCQMLAEAFEKKLYIVNAHQNTETGDLIGAQRPIRNRSAIVERLVNDLETTLDGQNNNGSVRDLESLLNKYQSLSNETLLKIPKELRERIKTGQVKHKALFEWCDGSLIHAMREGQYFLLDEISLADDSVLERLNSVLEPQRTILLAEKGAEESFVQAVDGFQFLATMNPGGDYGKRELSPALRNRFTEIWVPSLSEHEDLLLIVEAKLTSTCKHFAKPMVEFAEWFGHQHRWSVTQSTSIRDLNSWVSFINGSGSSNPYFAILHGAAMVYIDTLGANPAGLLASNPDNILDERGKCLQQLSILLGYDITNIYAASPEISQTENDLTIGYFSIKKSLTASPNIGFAFETPTTKLNAMRIARALQVQKPILIEGRPGVGKTTLIIAISEAVGRPLIRMNLSEQTDLMDLFGSDVPVEGAQAGQFTWRNAPFLQAMQKGDWVLLDEMNLASQSVLEGLNACLDHRGEVYISELNQTFHRHPNFRVFAAQNPHHQGGGRKGLPASFVNRFTIVYADVFRNDDMMLICQHKFPEMNQDIISNSIEFVSRLEQEVVHNRKFGSQGAPWEFNLRDTLRWLQLLTSREPLLTSRCPADFLNLIFRQRLRTLKDRAELDKIFKCVFTQDIPIHHLFHILAPDAYQVGIAYLPRNSLSQVSEIPQSDVASFLPELESIMLCVQQKLPCILAGKAGSGKSTLIQHVAAATGAELVEFPLNSEIDTMDLVGGYEQVDPQRRYCAFMEKLCSFLERYVLSSILEAIPPEAIELLHICRNIQPTSLDYHRKVDKYLTSFHESVSLIEITTFLHTYKALTSTSIQIEAARFEWVDGILVRALEEGKWLILDNANLCSPSVLDRLNSLLEPNGILCINEHRGLNGEPRIVVPHTNFRLFLTMDPQFGELSRAMRNRCVEIYLGAPAENICQPNISLQTLHRTDTSLQRYRCVVNLFEDQTIENQQALLTHIVFDHLSLADMPLLARFSKAAEQGLINRITPSTLQLFQQYFDAVLSGNEKSLGQAIGTMYEMLGKTIFCSQRFKDAQPIHPLQNSTLVPLLQGLPHKYQSYWLGAVLELRLDILIGRDEYKSEVLALAALKPSQMNRLQRSIVRDRVPSVSSDSTVRVATFLTQTLNALDEHIRHNLLGAQNWKGHVRDLRNIMQFWWETYRLASSVPFGEATFQAHLDIGANLFKNILSRQVVENTGRDPIGAIVVQSASQDLARRIYSIFQAELSREFTLTTGLSMETLWLHFRPTLISKIETLHTLIGMEGLAARFDSLRWRVSISVLELSNIVSSLVGAHYKLSTSGVDGQVLVETLGSELGILEQTISQDGEEATPYFSSQFEALRQYQTLQDVQSIRPDLMVLANSPTVALMHLRTATKTSLPLQTVNYLWCQKEIVWPIKGTFSASLIHKLNNVDDVNLGSLKLLEAELPILGQHLINESSSLCRDQISKMNLLLSQIIQGVFEAHNNGIQEHIKDWTDQLATGKDVSILQLADIYLKIGMQDAGSDTSSYFQKVLQEHLKPALVAIAAAGAQYDAQLKFSSMAWIHLAVGYIILYVPDRPFDPDKRQRLESQQHRRMKQHLEHKLAALRQFEVMFTGQNTNLRCVLLEEELRELGEPVKAQQATFRPDPCELDQLQGEFNNLLNVILRSKPHELVMTYLMSGSEDAAQRIKLLQNNLAQIIRRFSERFRPYNDIVVPLVGILRCLQVGLFIADMVTAEGPTWKSIRALSKLTPFLGGGPTQDEIPLPEYPMEVLANINAVSFVESPTNFNAIHRELLFGIFQSCYDQWSKQLDASRKEAEYKKSLYRFRGSAEDESSDDQEEFNELFPTYDEDSSHPSNIIVLGYSARDTAVALSNAHAGIFGGAGVESVMCLLRQISKRIGTLYSGDLSFPNVGMNRKLFPGALIMLSDQFSALSSVSKVDNYNFYTDANLSEARILVGLIHKIRSKFQELQKVEEIGYMIPLTDVIASCTELLKFRHTEPLAKIITKVEKIHGFMHEWQFGGWASRTNSVLSLYNDLTSTIVNWRRLELATWAKLFDMEDKKCDDDAKSWWFIAYEVVVAVPLSLVESESMLRNYSERLLQELETYFLHSFQGQFAQRLLLLKQLQKHLELLVLDMPSMTTVATAVANFTDIYKRYVGPIQENIRKGRQSLEKAMRDVLLLASWKDTNIVALRESAQRSHHKLFKLVRKYRALLGHSTETVLKQGLPEETEKGNRATIRTPIAIPIVDKSALEQCEKSVPRWNQRSTRLLNISNTVNIMHDSSFIPDSALQAPDYLESFLANIITSNVELRKATPSVLTEDNKDTLAHLKLRKRKLFADTLKQVRQMGINFNLGTSALASQSCLSVILANSHRLQSTSVLQVDDINYYHYRTLDLIPQARATLGQHSPDLTRAEVARSIGLLEGLLKVCLKQRNTLACIMANSAQLEQAIRRCEALWNPSTSHIKLLTTISTYEATTKWLPNILKTGLELVKIHDKLGNKVSEDVQSMLLSWIDVFENLVRLVDSLPDLPKGIKSTASNDLERNINQALFSLRQDLTKSCIQWPSLDFILHQILPWTTVKSSPIARAPQNGSILALDQKLSKTCDYILVAVENITKSIAAMPNSVDDPSWLIKTDTCLGGNFGSNRTREIISQIEEAFEILGSLDVDNEETGKTAGALFAVALPIFQQYSNIISSFSERYAQLHRATCKMTYILTKIFTSIASEGFCTPSEVADAQAGKADKLEEGTGLGDSEGAEDISKDIQNDEDLSDLAQKQSKDDNKNIEDERDAVDMADEEMDGEIGDAEEYDQENGSGHEGSGDEIDEETGDVDDLDPNTVDEKMWNAESDKAETSQGTDNRKGRENMDEKLAAQESEEQREEIQGADDEETEGLGAEQSEEVNHGQVEKQDSHPEEGETLELPEDMELDGPEQRESALGSDDDMDGLSDVHSEDEDKLNQENDIGENDSEGEDADIQKNQDIMSDLDVLDADADEDSQGQRTEEAGKRETEGENQDLHNQDGLLRDTIDHAVADLDSSISTDAQGVGEYQSKNEADDEFPITSNAKYKDGDDGGEPSEKGEAPTQDGELSRQLGPKAPPKLDDDNQSTKESLPFKKLGEALEKWYRQQADIKESLGKEDKHDQTMDTSREPADFRHLQDEEAEADAQAIGTATEDQARAVDDSMAVDTKSKDLPEIFQPDESDEDGANKDKMDIENLTDRQQGLSSAYEGRAGAIIKQSSMDLLGDVRDLASTDLDEEIEEVDNQLSSTSIEEATTMTTTVTVTQSRQLWAHYESVTRDLSFALTEQLRLILAPTIATKMRGDFRTGKRLNIKRIIPYIASQYKRDKIWMRRSIPSKRSYQILLAVDDSKSMAETGSGLLAFETLVMVSRSLSMLEIGQICVVGFGENVKVAHDFEAPFSADSGPRIFQDIGFQQNQTNVTKLVRESIDIFRQARAKTSGNSTDLWQLQLIISDGICNSSEHEPIRRLLREAIEERIMMVFVIVDDLTNKKKGESVMDLKEAKFVKDEMTSASQVRIERYLDTFPFQYYLIVSDVRDLPGVLAALLRQWFAEVAGSSC